MTNGDVYLDDMGFLMDTDELDRVLAGAALANDAPIARFVEDLREAFPPSPVPGEVEAGHLTAIVAAANENSVVEAATVPSRLERLRSSVAARVGALTLAAGSGLTGAAYAGVLPDPVQSVVSDAAALVGVELPHPDEFAGGQDGDEGAAEHPEEGSGEGRHDGSPADAAGSEGPSKEAGDRSGRARRSAGAGGDDDAGREAGASDDEGDGGEDLRRQEQETDDDSDTSDSGDDEPRDSDREGPGDGDDDESDDSGEESDPADTGDDMDGADDGDDEPDPDEEGSSDSDLEEETSDDAGFDSEDLENDLED